ncbi:hypothetical protein M406DRAFT_75465 [Cryphonectria parasitica EP155]|uniref:Uncharacterized protein n=1 Tax=Cryphonectria parasitica (strain ATCC 38755 / EP155) TaxID=660469 RepID=A0A9P4Y8D7_CRYP1|nr:uncharacterized protein M406DRAFT_75465 [Cryphonectria parasitica EP155]KAF3768299.1 hypothetical protein M406DRAFT_75465 [Cryphonectria parasitica EP155]
MAIGSPTGGSQASEDELPGNTRLANGEEATFFNTGYLMIGQDLENLARKRRKATPDFELLEPEARPMPARQQCAGLWPSLPDGDAVDQVQRDIPDAWYQLCRVSALLQFIMLMAEKGGFWRRGLHLFGDGSNHEGQSDGYWRHVADTLCDILHKMEATKAEAREHMQKIPLDEFWKVELENLEPIAAEAEQKYHEAMVEQVRQVGLESASSTQQTAQGTVSQPATPQALRARQPGKVRKSQAARPNRTRPRTQKAQESQESQESQKDGSQLRTMIRGNVASRAALNFSEDSKNSGPAMGSSFASTASGKSSRMAYGLNTKSIIDIEKRSLRNQKKKTNQTPASTGVLDGRVDTRKQYRRTQRPRKG